MEPIADIDIVVGNMMHIDFTIYHLWLQHKEAGEARNLLMPYYNNDCDYEQKDVELMLYNSILDQYRIYGMIEPMLHNPLMLQNQIIYQLCPESQEKLIASYYKFDEVVIREILGKKLNKSTRRDLDDIAAKTQRNLRCCQRQFDNCRRVFKAVEDMPGNLVDNIQKLFLLPSELAWNYATIAFLANQKLECSKRKLHLILFKTFIACSKYLIENWTVGAVDSTSLDVDIELDQEFFHELRAVKILTSDLKLLEKHKALTFKKMKNRQQLDSNLSDSLFRHVSRGIISIASSLYKTKEMRNFFSDVYEKVVEPCKASGLESSKFQSILEAYQEAGLELSQLQLYRRQWTRYMNAMTKCAVEMYQ